MNVCRAHYHSYPGVVQVVRSSLYSPDERMSIQLGVPGNLTYRGNQVVRCAEVWHMVMMQKRSNIFAGCL